MVAKPRSRVMYPSFSCCSLALAWHEVTISPSISLTWSTVNFSVSCVMRQYNDYIGERSTCLRDINLLYLQVVKDIGECLQRNELSGTDVLLTLP